MDCESPGPSEVKIISKQELFNLMDDQNCLISIKKLEYLEDYLVNKKYCSENQKLQIKNDFKKYIKPEFQKRWHESSSLAEYEHNCTAEEFEDCLTILKSISETDELALAATREELHLVCRKLQKGVRCIEDHSFRCFTLSQKRLFNSVVSDSRHVIDDLCVPGKLQNDYLRYAPCLRNVSTDEKKCAIQYRRLTNKQGHENTEEIDDNINDGLKMHCCAFTKFVECQHQHVLQDCGQLAHHFVQSHLERMSGSLLNEHCALYTHGSNACLFNGNSSQRLSSIHCDIQRKLFTAFACILTFIILAHR